MERLSYLLQINLIQIFIILTVFIAFSTMLFANYFRKVMLKQKIWCESVEKRNHYPLFPRWKRIKKDWMFSQTDSQQVSTCTYVREEKKKAWGNLLLSIIFRLLHFYFSLSYLFSPHPSFLPCILPCILQDILLDQRLTDTEEIKREMNLLLLHIIPNNVSGDDCSSLTRGRMSYFLLTKIGCFFWHPCNESDTLSDVSLCVS